MDDRTGKEGAQAGQLALALGSEPTKATLAPAGLMPWLERRCSGERHAHNTNPPAQLEVTWRLDGDETHALFTVEDGTYEAARIAEELMDHAEPMGAPWSPIIVAVYWPSGRSYRAWVLSLAGYVLAPIGAP